MAEVNNGEEPTTLPTKRTPDLTSETPPKKQKLETPTQNDVVQKPEDENEQEVEVEVEEEKEEEKSNGKAVIDRKGKGILIEEKEEGDDDDDDDSDDSDHSDSDSGSDSGAGNNLSGEESDFVDDPLAEVDLDNILPSRTRRRITHPGAYIANDIPDDDSDNSDDPDA